MELARQQHDREQRQQSHREQRAEHRFAREHASGIRSRERLGEQRQRSVEHPERDEDADADEGN